MPPISINSIYGSSNFFSADLMQPPIHSGLYFTVINLSPFQPYSPSLAEDASGSVDCQNSRILFTSWLHLSLCVSVHLPLVFVYFWYWRIYNVEQNNFKRILNTVYNFFFSLIRRQAANLLSFLSDVRKISLDSQIILWPESNFLTMPIFLHFHSCLDYSIILQLFPPFSFLLSPFGKLSPLPLNPPYSPLLWLLNVFISTSFLPPLHSSLWSQHTRPTSVSFTTNEQLYITPGRTRAVLG